MTSKSPPTFSKFDYHALFRHLEVFIKIVEHKSISVAAEKLNLTPSTTSRTLAQLEESLGVILFRRTTRSLSLTETGTYLYERALLIMNEVDESLTKISNFKMSPQGELKITCSIAFAVAHLIEIIGAYRDDNPDVNLFVDMNDQLLNLNEESFDIALRITPVPPDNYSVRKICDIHWVYCCSREYLEKNGEPLLISDLESHTCLINPNVSDTWRYKFVDDEAQPLTLHKTIMMNSSIGLLHAALQGQGIVCLPTYLLNQYIESKELVPILLNHAPKQQQYGLYVLYHPTKYSVLKIRSFIDFFKEKITREPYWDDWMADYDIPWMKDSE